MSRPSADGEYLRGTSVVPPCGRRRYYGGTTEVPYRRTTDTSDEGRTSGSASDGQPNIGNVTETTEAGQGRDGGAVRRVVLANGSLTALALGSCSGRGVGRTSGLTLTEPLARTGLWTFLLNLSPEANPKGWQRVAGGRQALKSEDRNLKTAFCPLNTLKTRKGASSGQNRPFTRKVKPGPSLGRPI